MFHLQSVKKNKVYVVEYPPLEGLKMMPDFIKNDRPTMKMKSHSSPIALFAVDPMKRLNVVAIQNISTQGDLNVYVCIYMHYVSYY